MNLIRTKVLGFCVGVRRAVEAADKAISAAQALPPESPAAPIYTLGHLIHNPQVLAALSDKGIKVFEESDLHANSLSDIIKDATVIIRAHGVIPETEQLLREKGANIIDATCPHVKANQNTARTLAEKGYILFLAGEKDHAEVKSIYGYGKSGKNCIIVGNPEEAEQAALQLASQSASEISEQIKTALIGQTTISDEEYQKIANAIKKYFSGLEVKKASCRATIDRQDALRELIPQVDAVIIAGGRESANTRRLLSIAQSYNKPAWLIETAEEISQEMLNIKTMGLCAGASTPDHIVDEIEQVLRSK